MWTRLWAKPTRRCEKMVCFLLLFIRNWCWSCKNSLALLQNKKHNTTAWQHSPNKGCCNGVRKKARWLKLDDACCGETSAREKKRVRSILLKLNWCVLVFSFYTMVYGNYMSLNPPLRVTDLCSYAWAQEGKVPPMWIIYQGRPVSSHCDATIWRTDKAPPCPFSCPWLPLHYQVEHQL